MLKPEQQAAMEAAHRREKATVKLLGDSIGYGRLMQLTNEVWREKALALGRPGSEFVYGPCACMTVVCGCREQGKVSCDWCNGAGWLTPRVRQAQAEAQKK